MFFRRLKRRNFQKKKKFESQTEELIEKCLAKVNANSTDPQSGARLLSAATIASAILANSRRM